jgi:hypothetical protein
MPEISRFICGMSRGGTTWLGHCLNEHPQVATFGESLYWGRGFVAPNNGKRYTEEEGRMVLLRLSHSCRAFIGDAPGNLKQLDAEGWELLASLKCQYPCTPGQLFQSICRWVADREGVSCVVEKTPHHIDWIERISENLPDTRFIVMIRDPYGFMLSYKHQGDRKIGKAKEHFSRLYHPIGCALVWRRYMSSARSAKKRFSDSIRIVEFECLKNSPEESWESVLQFFELPSYPLVSVLQQNSSFLSERKELSSIDLFWMNLIAGRELARAGYAKRASGVHLREFFHSLLSLLPWSIYVTRRLSSSVSGSLLKYLLKKL